MSIQSFERRLNSALAAVEVGGSVRLLSALYLVHFIQIHVISIVIRFGFIRRKPVYYIFLQACKLSSLSPPLVSGIDLLSPCELASVRGMLRITRFLSPEA